MKLHIFMIKKPNFGSNFIFLAIIFIDQALKKTKKYYPQGFLKKHIYIEKLKMVIRYITIVLLTYSHDYDKENSHKED